MLEQTARQLAKVGERLNAANMEWRPAPGKWNAREILCHLADCEIAFGFRLRQTLAEKHHVIQPFDQEKWAGMYGGLSARSAISAFSALREWDLGLIGSTRRSRNGEEGHSPRARRHDLPHHRRDDGRPRHQPPRTARRHRRRLFFVVSSVASAFRRTSG